MDDNHVVFVVENQNKVVNIIKIYTSVVWGNPLVVNKDEWVWQNGSNIEELLQFTSELKPELLLENCYFENGDLCNYKSWRLSVSTLEKTEYYKVVYEDGHVKIVNEKNYVAPAPQNYIFYPINR